MNVLGRPLGAGEIFRISAVKNIVNLYRDREASPNWAAWIKANPVAAGYLDEAYKIAVEHGMVTNG